MQILFPVSCFWQKPIGKSSKSGQEKENYFPLVDDRINQLGMGKQRK
jgi:hypothetical protein